jgi:hypothetical protein
MYGWRLPEDLGLAPEPALLKSLADRTQPKRPLPDLKISPGSCEYINRDQGVKYIIRFVNAKDEFVTALKTPGIMAIYAGHARYGRGPCFSDPALHVNQRCPHPSENWGEGTDKTKWGLFRWGYQYIPIPATETSFYGYTATPALSTVKLRSQALATDRHPDISIAGLELTKKDALVDKLKDARADLSALVDKYKDLPRHLHEDLEHLIDSQPDDLQKYLNVASGQSFWVVRASQFAKWFTSEDRKRIAFQKSYHLPMVVHVAGWTERSGSPIHLKGTDIKCRCLCHFGCSTKKHNWHLLRWPRYKGWRRSGNEKYAYFTSNLAYNFGTNFFLYHILTFNQQSAGRSWKDLLDYAVKKANMDLLASNANFRIF